MRFETIASSVVQFKTSASASHAQFVAILPASPAHWPQQAANVMLHSHFSRDFTPLPLASSALRLRVSAAFLPAADFCSAVRAAAERQ